MRDGCVNWPREAAEGYREAKYWRDETLGSMLRGQAASRRSADALVAGDLRWSYGELDTWADRLAAGLHGLGIRGGDRVVVQLANVPEFVALCFALFRLGAIPIFGLPTHRSNEIHHLCELSQATACVIPAVHRGFDHRAMLADEVLPRVPSIKHVLVAGDPAGFTALTDVDADPIDLPPADPADVAFFLLSGGTTALPKLIPRTHNDYRYQARTAGSLSGLGTDTSYLVALPIGFNFSWGCPGVIGTLQAGGRAVISPGPSPQSCFELIERERVTLTSVVPTIAHMWLEEVEETEHDLSSLRVLQIGSAKLHREVAERIEPAFRTRLQQVFGMAEGLLSFTRLNDPQETVLSTQGRPISPGDEVRVVDESGHEVPSDVPGELLTRGPYTLRGYYRAPEHNAKAFTEDGFYRSGDLVRRTANGELIIEGRIKDVINKAGDKISATEVEGHLTNHPDIEQAAVVPLPDPVLGERVYAYLVAPGEQPTRTALNDLLRARGVANFKFPDQIEYVDAFPLTGLNKVDKKTLASRLSDGTATQH